MSADIIPADEAGEFTITKAQLTEIGSASLAAFSLLLEAEADRRNLDVSITYNHVTWEHVVQWRPRRTREGDTSA